MNQSTGVGEITGNWDYSSLPSNIRLGADCWLENKGSFGRFRSTLRTGLRLGDRVRVFTWATFNIEPTGYVEVGDDCVLIGPIFMCAERITVGSRVTISYNVTIADTDFHPHDPVQRKLDAIANAPSGDRSQRPAFVCKPVMIEDDVSIGIGAILLKGVRIGQGARIGAGAVVTCNVPAGAEVVGNPARPMERLPA